MGQLYVLVSQGITLYHQGISAQPLRVVSRSLERFHAFLCLRVVRYRCLVCVYNVEGSLALHCELRQLSDSLLGFTKSVMPLPPKVSSLSGILRRLNSPAHT